MAEKKTSEQSANQTDEQPAVDAELAAGIGYGEPDEEGNRHKVETVGKQKRVYLLSKTGLEVNALVDDEAEGKKALAAYLKAR